MNKFTRTLCFSFSLLFLVAAATYSQTVEPTPPQRPPADDGDVVKISTNLIQIDVTVTDSKGNPITDLRADEVEIFENGKKQAMTNFSFISSARPAASERPSPNVQDGISVPVTPTIPRADQIRRTFVLVVDDLSLSFESAYRTRQAIRKFVNEQMEDGDLVAIVRAGGSVGALQQFTTNKTLLLAAAEAVRWNPRSRRMRAFTTISPGAMESLQTAGAPLITAAEVAAEQQAQMAEEQPGLNVGELFESLEYVVKGLSELPGRKAVILFTDGFSLSDKDPVGYIAPQDVSEHLSAVIEAANRAAVVFYTIDSRGLQFTGPTAADSIKGSTNPQQYSAIWSTRSSQLYETQGGPSVLARKTGGLAFTNQNDLGKGIERAMRDQSYYLIGYEPDSETFDPAKIKFNRFEVRVSRPGANVRYRNGFLGVADREVPAVVAAPTLTVEEQLNQALRSPFAKNDIKLYLNPLYGNHPRTGNYVRSLLHVDVNDLQFTELPNGWKKLEIAILAGSFGMDGAVADQIGKGYAINLPPDVFEKMKTTGFVYEFTFPVKKPGSFQYRVVLRDQKAGTIGSASQFIEIPDFKQQRPYVSGIVLQGYTSDEWQTISDTGTLTSRMESDIKTDTSRRSFKVGSVVQYGFEIYNARPGPAKRPDVTTRIRIFRDGELVLNGNPTPVEPTTGPGGAVLLASGGAIKLTDQMEPGDYVLQVIVIDRQAKEKRQLATQYVQFEVVP